MSLSCLSKGAKNEVFELIKTQKEQIHQSECIESCQVNTTHNSITKGCYERELNDIER